MLFRTHAYPNSKTIIFLYMANLFQNTTQLVVWCSLYILNKYDKKCLEQK